MTIDPDRRAGLLAAKLDALVRENWDGLAAHARSGSFRGASTLIEGPGGRGWILIDEDDGNGASEVRIEGTRRMGAALAVARRSGIAELHLLVDDPEIASVLARRAALFASPPTVWSVHGRDLHEAAAAPPAIDLAPAPGAELYRPVLEAAGLEVVVEGGNLIGEYRGLEVARVVADPDGATHVEVGVGRFDREVGAMMFQELSETDSLARAVDHVAKIRTSGALRHPLNQLVPERWVRSVLLLHPELVGAESLRSVGSALPRQNLKESGIATAIGTDLDGNPIVVTSSIGVDLDLVPSAADDRLSHAPDARLVLAVPQRDALAVTTELAGHLVVPAEVIPIPDAWRSLSDREAR